MPDRRITLFAYFQWTLEKHVENLDNQILDEADFTEEEAKEELRRSISTLLVDIEALTLQLKRPLSELRPYIQNKLKDE